MLPGCLLTGCRDQPDDTTAGFNEQSRQCLSCHQVELDSPHRVDCITCHLPTDDSTMYPEGHEAVLGGLLIPIRPTKPAEAVTIRKSIWSTTMTIIS